MAIGRQGSVGKATSRSGPVIGRQGKKAGPIGKTKSMHASALTLDQDRTKVAYPTTSTTAAP
jgi:hypothetical protein